MKSSDIEKDWFSRFCGSLLSETEKPASAKKRTPRTTKPKTEEKTRRGFQDVAGMEDLKRLVTEGFINVLKHKKCAAAYGIKPPSMLFYGPAGCGKTFFAEKMAEEVGISFVKIVPDDLACIWIHGTQQKIGEVFREAEKKAPVLLFFDEFDAMVPCRSDKGGDQSFNGEVNEFLCMLNNASDRGIYVLAATNHPERIDKAVLRTGRIDEIIYVDMPDKEARQSQFKLELAKLPFDSGIDYDRLASLTDGFNCSDISYIVKTASRKMFNASIKNARQPYRRITQSVLEDVISLRSPSVDGKTLRGYECIRSELSPKDGACRRARIGF